MRALQRIAVAMLTLLSVDPAVSQGLLPIFPEGVPGYATEAGVTVLSRTRPETDPLGIQAGGVLVYPRLEESIGYDDNVLGGANRVGSWLIGTRPSVLLRSDWSRDAFGAYFSAADTRYLGQPRQSRTDGTASLGGTIDIGRDQLTLSAAHLNQHQDRSELAALASDRPVAVQLDDARASYVAAFGPWTWTPEAGIADWHFADTTVLGLPVSQSYRDRLVLRAGTTLHYELAPLRNLVFVTRALSQHYTNPIPGQASLDSTGYQVLLGFDYDDNAVWRYRLLLGGETRQFSSAIYRAHTAAIAEGEVTWNPSGMTTMRATLTRSIEDAAQEGVAGFTYTAGKLGLDHELRRDVLVSLSAELQQADFLQGGGRQTAHGVGVGITWLLDRTTRISATYDLSGVHGSSGSTANLATSYNRDLALLIIRFGL